jgi:hypothetical protein
MNSKLLKKIPQNLHLISKETISKKTRSFKEPNIYNSSYQDFLVSFYQNKIPVTTRYLDAVNNFKKQYGKK